MTPASSSVMWLQTRFATDQAFNRRRILVACANRKTFQRIDDNRSQSQVSVVCGPTAQIANPSVGLCETYRLATMVAALTPVGASWMTDLDDIYSDDILTIAAQMPLTDRLDAPQATATAQSKLCGSTITVDLTMKDDVVSEYGQSVKACLLGQTAATVMGQQIIGSTATELRQVSADMRAMLKEGGPAPAGRWSTLSVLAPVRHFKARHASTLLVFEAVEKCLDQIEAARAAA